MLTPRLERYIRATFPATEAERMLRELADWRISYADEPPSERLTAAVVFVAEHDGLDEALRLAELDYRDLLMAADLGSGDWPALLEGRLDTRKPR